MRKHISNLIYQSILSKNFFIAVLLGFVTGLYNVFENMKMTAYLVDSGVLNLFLQTMLFKRNLFEITAPFIACIASSVILYDELESGFAKQLITRYGFKKYFFTRIASTIVVATLAIASISCLLFLFDAAVCPQASYKIFKVDANSSFASIYYKSMFMYIGILQINFFIAFASYALLGCGVFLLSNNYYAGYVVPGAFYIFCSYSRGTLFNSINFLPSSTFSIHLNLTESLLYDHLLVLIIGLIFCIWGYKKWSKLITF